MVTQAIGAVALAVRMAFPVLVAVFFGHVALGVVGRTAPQLNVNSLGFTVTILAGGAALYLLAPPIAELAARTATAAFTGGPVMAEDEAAEDKTEAPSGKRLNEAYEQGQIPLGRELNAVAGFAVGTVALMMVGTPLRDALIRLVAASAGGLASPDLARLQPLLARPLMLALSACAAAGLAGAVAYLVQTRAQIWPHLAMPDLSKVFGGGKLGQLFTRSCGWISAFRWSGW